MFSLKQTPLFSFYILAQYAVFLYDFFTEWRKNPHWSFSCCLGLLLPLNDLQGDLRDIAGTDILTNQLQTGQIDNPNLLSEVKDSGAIDVTLEEADEEDDNIMKIQNKSCQDAEQSDTRRHQGTQTELCSGPISYSEAHEPMSKLHEFSL